MNNQSAPTGTATHTTARPAPTGRTHRRGLIQVVSARTDRALVPIADHSSEAAARVLRRFGLFAVVGVVTTLAACGGGTSSDRASSSAAPLGANHGRSSSNDPIGSSVPTTDTATASRTGTIQGADNNNNPYGNFNVTVKVAPHLESVDFGDGPYAPENPLQPDGSCSAGGQFQGGFCDPAGYQFIHFTLTFTNRTTTPEVFGTVGFSPAVKPMVYLAAPSSDQGMTPASASFGGPTNGLEPVTKDNVTSYWEANRDGPGDLFRFSEPFAQNHFLFNLNPSGRYSEPGGPVIPSTLNPGQSFDIEYASDAVAPTAPLDDLTLWAGYNPRQLPNG